MERGWGVSPMVMMGWGVPKAGRVPIVWNVSVGAGRSGGGCGIRVGMGSGSDIIESYLWGLGGLNGWVLAGRKEGSYRCF